MGFFNILTTEIVCPNCGAKSLVQIQFKYGQTRQLKYQLGDAILWGVNEIGSPVLTNVKAYGIAESTTCSVCNEDKIPEEYDVFIKNNVLTGIVPIKGELEYLSGEGEYVVL